MELLLLFFKSNAKGKTDILFTCTCFFSILYKFHDSTIRTIKMYNPKITQNIKYKSIPKKLSETILPKLK